MNIFNHMNLFWIRSILFHTALLLFLITACSRIPDQGETTVFFKGKAAQWIQDSRPLPTEDSLLYLDQPAPLFRKAFKTEGAIKEAKLFITAAGYYQAYLNGQAIGENVLDPAWTDFSKRIYYSEYDLTGLVGDGSNCLGVSLGNGFYVPHF